MNPVIGLDVAKGESQVQAYLERKNPYKKSFKVKHDLDGLASLLDFIKELELEYNAKVDDKDCKLQLLIIQDFKNKRLIDHLIKSNLFFSRSLNKGAGFFV